MGFLDRALDELEAQLVRSTELYQSFGAATDAIPGTEELFGRRIAVLEPQVQVLLQRIATAKQRHEAFLEDLAITEMRAQQERLLTYRAQARFALASVYDRMQARSEE